MFFLIFYSISMLTHRSICSFVIEEDEDMTDLCSGIDYSKYCGPIGVCNAGSHVMCMYYKPDQLMGPHCIDGRMVRLTAETKKIILDKINGVRGEIASGIARGENDVFLPRGYGMIKVKWDKRLALFAQVWANQCRFTRDDQCRATKRFPNPGQFLGTFRYTIPEWRKQDDLNRSEPLTKQCLTESKVKYAIASSIDVLLIERYWATRDHVLQHTTTNPVNNYLMMAHGKASHVGCGLSAYKDYHWSEDLQQYEFYYLELVCNLSAQPEEGEQLYEIEPPTPKRNFTENCGCLNGYIEDENCLCVHPLDYEPPTDTTTAKATDSSTSSDRAPTDTGNSDTSAKTTNDAGNANDATARTTNDGGDVNDATAAKTTLRPDSRTTPSNLADRNQTEMDPKEKPTVLILPIITVEEAPPDMRQRPWKSDISVSQGNSRKLFPSEDNLNDIEKQQMESQNMSYFHQNSNQSTLAVRNFHPNNKSETSLQNYQTNNLRFGSFTSPNSTASSSRKHSIFTRVAPFDLTSQNRDKNHDKNLQESDKLKKNLKKFLKEVPRKDLSRLEELLLKFIIKKQSQAANQQNEISVNPLSSSLIRPIKSYHEANRVPKIQRFVSKELKYHNRRMGNLIEDNENMREDSKKIIPSKIKDEDRAVKAQTQFTMPVIRKQNPLVNSKDNDRYLRNTYYSNTFGEEYTDKRTKDYNSAKTDIGWVNDVRAIANFGNSVDDKSKYVEDEMHDYNIVTVDDLKLKRTLYLNNEINKLKSKLKHLRQYAHQNNDERLRPLVAFRNERRSTKLDETKND